MSAPLMPADLVAALLSTRDDPATAHFDRVLAQSETAGTIDAGTARELRYWQRQSIESLTAHAAVVLPAALEARARADAEARAAVAEADVSWQQARAIQGALERTAAAAAADEPDESGAPSRRLGTPGLSVVSDDD